VEAYILCSFTTATTALMLFSVVRKTQHGDLCYVDIKTPKVHNFHIVFMHFILHSLSHGQLSPLRGRSSPFGTLSRRELNPFKLKYDPDRPDGQLKLAANAFNQLGQYTSSPGHRDYS